MSPAPLRDQRRDRFIRVDLAMSIPLLEPGIYRHGRSQRDRLRCTLSQKCTSQRLRCTLSSNVYIASGPRAHFPKKCTSHPAMVHTFPKSVHHTRPPCTLSQKVYIVPGAGAHFPKSVHRIRPLCTLSQKVHRPRPQCTLSQKVYVASGYGAHFPIRASLEPKP